MKKHLLILLLASLALSSCVFRPRSVLSNKKMEDVLVDLHTAEAVLQVAGYNYGHQDDCNVYYGMILEKHGVTQAEFDSSLVWYTAHPQYFQSVYPKVLKRLQERHDLEVERLSNLDEELKRAIADSLARKKSFYERPDVDEVIRQTCYGWDGLLFHPHNDAPFFTDSIWARLDSVKNAVADSIASENQLISADFSGENMPSDEKNAPSDEKNKQKTCEIQEKDVPLQPVSTNGNTMLQRKPI